MILSELMNNKEIEYTKNVVEAASIKEIEKDIGVSFEKELTEYILKYGYLAYKHVELYGINSVQMLDSDMVKQTKYLHEYFPKTAGLIAIENTGDGNYVLVSSDDEIYNYSSVEDSLQKLELKLFDYIVNRFQEID